MTEMAAGAPVRAVMPNVTAKLSRWKAIIAMSLMGRISIMHLQWRRGHSGVERLTGLARKGWLHCEQQNPLINGHGFLSITSQYSMKH